MATSRIHPVHVGNASYESYILGLGPAGYWRLGETSGTVAEDMSTGGSNGTWLIGSSSEGSKFLTRDSRPSSVFDGSSHIGGPASNSLVSTAGTLIAWVKPTDVTSDDRIITLSEGAASRFAILGGRASGEASAFMRDGSQALIQLDSGGSTYANGVQYMLATTAEEGDGRLFLDGAQVDSSANVDAAKTFDLDATVMKIGSSAGASLFFLGDMQEVVVFNYALSPAQIEALYLIGKNGP